MILMTQKKIVTSGTLLSIPRPRRCRGAAVVEGAVAMLQASRPAPELILTAVERSRRSSSACGRCRRAVVADRPEQRAARAVQGRIQRYWYVGGERPHLGHRHPVAPDTGAGGCSGPPRRRPVPDRRGQRPPAP